MFGDRARLRWLSDAIDVWLPVNVWLAVSVWLAVDLLRLNVRALLMAIYGLTIILLGWSVCLAALNIVLCKAWSRKQKRQ